MPVDVTNPAFFEPEGMIPNMHVTSDSENDADPGSSLDEESQFIPNENPTLGWDVFKAAPEDDNDNDREHCVFRASQCLKLVSIPLIFLLILAGLVVNKGILLYVTSQMMESHNTTCNVFEDTGTANQTTTGKFFFKCVAIPDHFPAENEAALSCIQHEDKTPIYGPLRAEGCDIWQLRWTWSLLLLMCLPYVFSIIRNIWLICLKHEPNPRRDVFVTSMIIDTMYSGGVCMLVFYVIPDFDNAIKAALALNGLSLVPSVLLLLELPKPSKRAPFIILLNILCMLSQLSAGLLWPILDTVLKGSPFKWQVPVAMILVSIGFWENYVPKQFVRQLSVPDFIYEQNKSKRKLSFLESMRSCKVKLSLYGNIWKVLITIATTMFIKHDISFNTWFSFFTKPNNCGDDAIQFTNLAMDSFYYDWLIVVSITLTVSLAVYFVARAAAKTQIQPATYSLAMICVTPVVIGSLIPMCRAWRQNPCEYSGIMPMYAFWSCMDDSRLEAFFMEEYGWVSILWWLSQAWITRHMWFPQAERLAKSKNIFVQPLVDAVVLDPWLAHNRRRRDENEKLGKELPTRAQSFKGPLGRQDSTEDSKPPGHKEEEIPNIYMCATMWHENKLEMLQILKSILRSDYDQFKRKLVQEKLEVVDPDYYTFEAHIFFDDAMTAHEEDEMDFSVNDFVTLLVESIDTAASSVHDKNIHIPDPTRYLTPYGGRLVWILPGENILVAHLKDKANIRHKKRWSQVMYMYYLLGYRLWNRIKHWEPAKQQRMADNTFLLALDGDVDFRPRAVRMLVDLMRKDEKVGAACGRIHPIGTGPMVWYQKFEYALGHWMQKATEHVLGCVLCSPGCFSLFRGSALMDENVMRTYTTVPTEPHHHVQYDQGEDRWLCTLLLQQGHRVEYSAASDAYTYAPEGFYEFYNQRRRWMPSTMANIMDLLMTWRRTIDKNENISLLYIAYQTILLFSSILGTGTIFLMIVGSIALVLNTNGQAGFQVPFAINFVALLIFVIVCYKCKSETQLFLAAVLTTVYSLVQMLVLVGILIQISDSGVGSPNAIFFFFVAGTFILAGILHPQEFTCLFHGFIYFLAIPSMYMLLMIYALTNLHVISWGTREVVKTKTEKEMEEEKKAIAEAQKAKSKGSSLLRLGQFGQNEEGFTFSVGDLWRCVCCPTRKDDREKEEYRRLLKQMERMETSFDVVSHKVDTLNFGEATEDEEAYPGHENWELGKSRPSGRIGRQISFKGITNGKINPMYDETGHIPREDSIDEEEPLPEPDSMPTIEPQRPEKPKWIDENDKIGNGAIECLNEKESQFFTELVEKYLKPLIKDKVQEEKVQMQLLELRNKMSGMFILVNSIFVVVVFSLQLNVEKVSIKWPLGDNLTLEPIGFLFLVFFALIMLVQIAGMVIHRATTFLHIISTTKLPCEQNVSGGTEEMEEHLATLQEVLDRDHSSSINSQAPTPEVSRRAGPDRRGTMYKLVSQQKRDSSTAMSSEQISNQLRSKIEKLKKDLDNGRDVQTIRLGKNHNTMIGRRKSLAALKFFQEKRRETVVRRTMSFVSPSEDKPKAPAPKTWSKSFFNSKKLFNTFARSKSIDVGTNVQDSSPGHTDVPVHVQGTPSTCRSRCSTYSSDNDSLYDVADNPPSNVPLGGVLVDGSNTEEPNSILRLGRENGNTDHNDHRNSGTSLVNFDDNPDSYVVSFRQSQF